jgi:hypothetical protein
MLSAAKHLDGQIERKFIRCAQDDFLRDYWVRYNLPLYNNLLHIDVFTRMYLNQIHSLCDGATQIYRMIYSSEFTSTE